MLESTLRFISVLTWSFHHWMSGSFLRPQITLHPAISFLVQVAKTQTAFVPWQSSPPHLPSGLCSPRLLRLNHLLATISSSYFFAAQEASMGNSQSIFTVRKLAKQTQNVHSDSRSSYGHGSRYLGHSPPLLSLSLGFISPLTLLCPMKCHKPLPPLQSLFLWQSGG